MTTTCASPPTTRRVVNPGTGALAWCPGCKRWRPAAQVPWSRMRRNATTGEVLATYAATPH